MEASEQAVPTVDAGDPSKQRSRRIIRKSEVRGIDGLSDTTRWRKIRDGTYPAPVQLGANSVGFYDDEVHDWVARRPRVNYAPSVANLVSSTSDSSAEPPPADDGGRERGATTVK